MLVCQSKVMVFYRDYYDRNGFFVGLKYLVVLRFESQGFWVGQVDGIVFVFFLKKQYLFFSVEGLVIYRIVCFFFTGYIVVYGFVFFVRGGFLSRLVCLIYLISFGEKVQLELGINFLGFGIDFVGLQV